MVDRETVETVADFIFLGSKITADGDCSREIKRASLEAQRFKLLPPVCETQVWSLSREDPLEKEMVTHSSILAWKIPWTEKPGRLQSMGLQRVTHNLDTEQQQRTAFSGVETQYTEEVL